MDPLELNTMSILHPCVFLIEKFKSGKYCLYRQLWPSFTSAYPSSSVNKNWPECKNSKHYVCVSYMM